MAKILVVEDDPNLQFVLSDNLGADGYDVAVAATGREGIARALGGSVDLMLLDLMLPDISGLEVCRAVRARDASLPILILTAKSDEVDKVVGLEVGADDYITKPFGMRELLARVRAALRRRRGPEPDTIAECWIGAARLDFNTRELVRGNQTDSLTRYECDLARFLAAHRGQTVERERILAEVWGEEPTSGNRTVDNYIARLRAKVEPIPATPRFIITVHGTGYKLV
ncbi:MAG: response regulator transcription factor [Lentisphaerae bacterium]|nr:response regulator transcription factor [Lentisphaerota bacterium]